MVAKFGGGKRIPRPLRRNAMDDATNRYATVHLTESAEKLRIWRCRSIGQTLESMRRQQSNLG